MRVDVLYFGILKDLFGSERDIVQLAEGQDVRTLLGLLRERLSSDVKVWSSLAVAVNRVYAELGTVLRDGDEVALLPPVSGGSCAR